MKSFFIVVVLMLRNGGAQTRIGGAPHAKESINLFSAPGRIFERILEQSHYPNGQQRCREKYQIVLCWETQLETLRYQERSQEQRHSVQHS